VGTRTVTCGSTIDHNRTQHLVQEDMQKFRAFKFEIRATEDV